MANIFHIDRPTNTITLGNTDTIIQLANDATIGVSTSGADLKLTSDGKLGVHLADGVEPSQEFTLGSEDKSEYMTISHSNLHTFFQTSKGQFRFQSLAENSSSYLTIRGNGSPGIGILYLFDEDYAEILDLHCQAGKGFIQVIGDTPISLDIQQAANIPVRLFSNATSGETPELCIYGYRTGDAKRYLQIGVGTDADDTASFDGLSNYYFDGNVGIGIATPDGALHVHTASAGVVTASSSADDLVVENDDWGGISILTPNNKAGHLLFGDSDSESVGGISYYHTDDSLRLLVNSLTRATLDGAGNFNVATAIQINETKVIGSRVIDARCDDAIDSGDVTTDGVIDSLRDAMITHGLIAAS